MQINFYLVAACALIPLFVGFIWYNPKVFGNAWMQATGMTPEKAKSSNMLLLFGMALFFGILISFAMMVWVIHQNHVYSIFADQQEAMKDPNSALYMYVNDFMSKYGHKFRTFKHGAFHGIIGGLFIALPIIGMNALFEQKSAKYIAIHTGFWTVCMALIGGVICQWA